MQKDHYIALVCKKADQKIGKNRHYFADFNFISIALPVSNQGPKGQNHGDLTTSCVNKQKILENKWMLKLKKTSSAKAAKNCRPCPEHALTVQTLSKHTSVQIYQ